MTMKKHRIQLDLSTGMRNPLRGKLAAAEGITPEVVLETVREVEADPQVKSVYRLSAYRLCDQFGVEMSKRARQETEPEVQAHFARLEALRAQARAAT
jgi:hypothetical protein